MPFHVHDAILLHLESKLKIKVFHNYARVSQINQSTRLDGQTSNLSISPLRPPCCAVPAECRPGVCPGADASVVLSSVPRPVLSAAVPLSVPQRDEGLPGQSGRPGHRVEQFCGCVKKIKSLYIVPVLCRLMQWLFIESPHASSCLLLCAAPSSF